MARTEQQHRRLRDLAMEHVVVVGDARETEIERGALAARLGRAVARLVRTPVDAPGRSAALAAYHEAYNAWRAQ